MAPVTEFVAADLYHMWRSSLFLVSYLFRMSGLSRLPIVFLFLLLEHFVSESSATNFFDLFLWKLGGQLPFIFYLTIKYIHTEPLRHGLKGIWQGVFAVVQLPGIILLESFRCNCQAKSCTFNCNLCTCLRIGEFNNVCENFTENVGCIY